MIFHGEEWELVPFDEIINCVEKDVLLYADEDSSDSCIVKCSRVEIRSSRESTIWYEQTSPDGCTHCTVSSSYYAGNCFYLPYIRKKNAGDGKSYCGCDGLTEDRWCYDTNKMEPICCRCKKRKSKGGSYGAQVHRWSMSQGNDCF